MKGKKTNKSSKPVKREMQRSLNTKNADNLKKFEIL